MTKIVKLLFTLSLLLNVTLIGVIGGHIYRQMQEAEWDEIRVDESISPETRKIMRDVYKGKHKQIWAMRNGMRDKRNALTKTILAESFNEEQFLKAAKALKEQNEKSFDSRVESFAKVLSKLPKEERAKLAQRTVDILAGQRKWDRSDGKPKNELDESKNPFAYDHHDAPEQKDKPKDKKKNP